MNDIAALRNELAQLQSRLRELEGGTSSRRDVSHEAAAVAMRELDLARSCQQLNYNADACDVGAQYATWLGRKNWMDRRNREAAAFGADPMLIPVFLEEHLGKQVLNAAREIVRRKHPGCTLLVDREIAEARELLQTRAWDLRHGRG